MSIISNNNNNTIQQQNNNNIGYTNGISPIYQVLAPHIQMGQFLCNQFANLSQINNQAANIDPNRVVEQQLIIQPQEQLMIEYPERKLIANFPFNEQNDISDNEFAVDAITFKNEDIPVNNNNNNSNENIQNNKPLPIFHDGNWDYWGDDDSFFDDEVLEKISKGEPINWSEMADSLKKNFLEKPWDFVLGFGGFTIQKILAEEPLTYDETKQVSDTWMKLKRGNAGEVINNLLYVMLEGRGNPKKAQELINDLQKNGFKANTYYQQWAAASLGDVLNHVIHLEFRKAYNSVYATTLKRAPEFLVKHPQLCKEFTEFLDKIVEDGNITDNEASNIKLLLEYTFANYSGVLKELIQIDSEVDDQTYIDLLKQLHEQTALITALPETITALMDFGKENPKKAKGAIELSKFLTGQFETYAKNNKKSIVKFFENSVKNMVNNPEATEEMLEQAKKYLEEAKNAPGTFLELTNIMSSTVIALDAFYQVANANGSKVSFEDSKQIAEKLMNEIADNPKGLDKIKDIICEHADQLENDFEKVDKVIDLMINQIENANENLIGTISDNQVAIAKSVANIIKNNPSLRMQINSISKNYKSWNSNDLTVEEKVLAMIGVMGPGLLKDDMEGVKDACKKLEELFEKYPQEMEDLVGTLEEYSKDQKKIKTLASLGSHVIEKLESLEESYDAQDIDYGVLAIATPLVFMYKALKDDGISIGTKAVEQYVKYKFNKKELQKEHVTDIDLSPWTNPFDDEYGGGDMWESKSNNNNNDTTTLQEISYITNPFSDEWGGGVMWEPIDNNDSDSDSDSDSENTADNSYDEEPTNFGWDFA